MEKSLEVSQEARLTPEAKDLICSLLCDVEHRLGTRGAHQIKAHPWFKDIVWDKLYEMEAAFKPEVNGELDTQNFMKFDEVYPPEAGARMGPGPLRKMLMTPKDLNFVGYTYKNFEAVKGLRYSFDKKKFTSPPRSSTDSILSDSGVHYAEYAIDGTETLLRSSSADTLTQ